MLPHAKQTRGACADMRPSTAKQAAHSSMFTVSKCQLLLVASLRRSIVPHPCASLDGSAFQNYKVRTATAQGTAIKTKRGPAYTLYASTKLMKSEKATAQ